MSTENHATSEPATRALPRGPRTLPRGPRTGKAPSFWRGAASGVMTLLLIAALLLALAVAVIPRLMGGAGLTVLSGSMEPTYSAGDMVVAVPQETYRIGDVVTFQPTSGDPTLITHRIVGVRAGSEGTEYITRGDANGADDPPIVAEQVMGRVLYHVPAVGHLAAAVGSHRHTLVVVIAAGLIGYGAYLVVADTARNRTRFGEPA
ncbi:MAG TPA: signal peptidase I [Beutenbergiaceae bacterium]|nr:signal peptidase I [Beutenbergiaceae bacterium]